MTYDSLYEYRERAYQYLGRAHDATFELIDAVLTTRHIYSFAELSQSPLFRRKWPSAYEALQDRRPSWRSWGLLLGCRRIPMGKQAVLDR